MASTQILQFANSNAANVLSPAAYAALTSIVANGFQSGILPSTYLNVVLRQCAFMATGLAQMIVNLANVNVNDDGNLTNLVTNMTAAVRLALTANVNAYTAGQSGTPVAVTPVASGATLTLNFAAGNNFNVGTVGAGGIGANFVLGTPTGVVPGQSGMITFAQNATGNFTITSRSTTWISANGVHPNLTAGASGRDCFMYYVDYDSHIILQSVANPS